MSNASPIAAEESNTRRLLHAGVMPPHPYYSDECVTLYNGDCREILPSLAAAHWMISDPPYGTETEKGYGRTQLHGQRGRRIAGDESLQAFNDALALTKTENLCVFASPKRANQVLAIIEAHGFEHRHELIWDKLTAGLSNAIRYQHESIYIATKGEFVGRNQTSILRGLSPARGGAHPHEKPENVVGALVEIVKPSSVIDPFVGTGTTLAVCRLRGVKCVGIELEEKYCEIAAKRCEQGLLWRHNAVYTPND